MKASWKIGGTLLVSCLLLGVPLVTVQAAYYYRAHMTVELGTFQLTPISDTEEHSQEKVIKESLETNETSIPTTSEDTTFSDVADSLSTNKMSEEVTKKEIPEMYSETVINEEERNRTNESN